MIYVCTFRQSKGDRHKVKAEMSGFSSCSELLVGLCEGRVNSKISSKCLFQNGDHSLIHACLKNAHIHVQMRLHTPVSDTPLDTGMFKSTGDIHLFVFL